MIDKASWVIKGGYKSKRDLVTAVKAAGCAIGSGLMRVINDERFILMPEGSKYDVFETTVEELTGKEAVTTTELYEIRNQLGFCDAPYETMLLICMQYGDQLRDQWYSALSKPLVIQMKSEAPYGSFKSEVFNSGVMLCVVWSFGSSWLDWDSAGPNRRWSNDDRLLVCRKRVVT